ncbi:hypothetical protein [Thalassospira sp.]|uniref:hypothetical protein n=1 Tax=Thalassospira sp. TaxID=1912094 RepID=UPI002734CE5E|nr:hypothetical protein [Thalassospira sp.]MDP2700134.1 hypothetical protein [Thalassospira sp.]
MTLFIAFLAICQKGLVKICPVAAEYADIVRAKAAETLDATPALVGYEHMYVNGRIAGA